MACNDLTDAITDHYEKMDPEARALLPLTRIYWPNLEERDSRKPFKEKSTRKLLLIILGF